MLLYNVGAILGGIVFGWLSQKIGRRYAIIAACMLSLLVLYFWAYGTTAVEIGLAAFLMQFAVQGAWGVVPVHLNELSPSEIRGTFPGLFISLAISSPPSTRRCRPVSRHSMAAITASRWRWWPARVAVILSC